MKFGVRTGIVAVTILVTLTLPGRVNAAPTSRGEPSRSEAALSPLNLPPPPQIVCCGGGAGYDRVAAASWADQHWSACTPNMPCFAGAGSGGDCTNFVSQALGAGGETDVGGWGSNNLDDNLWYMQYRNYAWQYSHSWTIAGDLWQFLYNSGRGSQWATYQPNTTTPNSGIWQGDALFYDLDGNYSIDHATFRTASGTDPNSGWQGDLVDSHSNSRFHAIWHLYPYNQKRGTTHIYAVHING